MSNKDKILLGHGSGGLASKRLIEDIFLKRFNDPILRELNDYAVFGVNDIRFAYSTDSYIVDPIFFPGGDIGSLAVNGTINDIAMGGAIPLYLSVGFIIEEGFPIADLEKIVDSMERSAREGGVKIITGDTKVVPRGGVDKIFINTSGIGIIQDNNINIKAQNVSLGDKVIISGTIGDHGIAVLSKREGIRFDTKICSDTAPLNGLVSAILDVCKEIHAMRDPTRGGIASTLNEIASASNVTIEIIEDMLPIKEEVRGACEILGLDPLYIANEGKMVLFVPEDKADTVLNVMKKHKYGKDSAIIGEVINSNNNIAVYLKTIIGGTRIIDMLVGEQLPRIC